MFKPIALPDCLLWCFGALFFFVFCRYGSLFTKAEVLSHALKQCNKPTCTSTTTAAATASANGVRETEGNKRFISELIVPRPISCTLSCEADGGWNKPTFIFGWEDIYPKPLCGEISIKAWTRTRAKPTDANRTIRAPLSLSLLVAIKSQCFKIGFLSLEAWTQNRSIEAARMCVNWDGHWIEEHFLHCVCLR